MNVLKNKKKKHIFNGSLSLQRISRETIIVLVLIFSILGTSLGIIYVKNVQRQLVSDINKVQQQNNEKWIEYSQLLLELGTWSTTARIYKLAKDRYGLDFPTSKKSNMVSVK